MRADQDGVRIGKDEVDMIQPSLQPGQFLCGGDVGQDQAVHGTLAEAISRPQQAGDGRPLRTATHVQGESIAGMQALSCGQVLADDHRSRPGQERHQGGCVDCGVLTADQVTAERRFGERIDTQQLQRLAPQLGRGNVIGNDRRGLAYAGHHP